MKKFLIIFITIAIAITGCEDQFEPVDENLRTLDDIYNNAPFGEAFLMNAYTSLPTNNNSFNEVATDDAVTNNKGSNLLSMATGSWSAINNPLEQWYNSNRAIMYLNKFLEEVDNITWSHRDEQANELFNKRHKGEAYALRAYFMYHLLKTHGGEGENGEMLGIPILTEPFDVDAVDLEGIRRDSFEDVVEQIYDDIDRANNYLPLDFGNVRSEGNMPDIYKEYDMERYNRVFGDRTKQRITKRATEAIKAKTALLAASPAFDVGQWEDAANNAARVLERIGGVGGMDDNGHLFFAGNNVRANNPEIIWRGDIEGGDGSNWREQDHFPPSIYGNGNVNPSQNLVDAFPMANGYPIDHANSNYLPDTPYVDRDPRLGNYIVYNGSNLGGTTIYTERNNTSDGVGEVVNSTRTGYYLRKLLQEDASVDPTAPIDRPHYTAIHIRYTEIFLIYAEAANEAWGPDGDGGNGFSAREVIGALRERAGISQPDDYLASITGTEDMRDLIRNERRLELSFEGFRFWDLRRWEEDLTEPVRGVYIDGNNYDVRTIENRVYDDHMIYGPIPYQEVIKSNLIQNRGW